MDELSLNDRLLQLTQGDITKEDTEIIANAANTGLRGGGGVDGAIHRAGGPEIMAECRRIGHCPTGTAVITGAGRLKAKNVIHTAGPVYRDGLHGEPELLASCYRSCLELAERNGAASIAFPSISTGIYGYPVGAAAKIALATALKHLSSATSLKLVRFVLFDSATYAAYECALAELAEEFGAGHDRQQP